MMVYAWQQYIIAEVSDVENFDIFHGKNQLLHMLSPDLEFKIYALCIQIVKILYPTHAHSDCKMNGQNIRPVHPFTMVPSQSLTPDCQVQPIGISNQELESLLAKPAKELPVQVSGATEMSRS